MAFPSTDRMPPPGKKPSAVIAIGIEPKGKPADGMADDSAGSKESEADAIVLRGGDKTCESCTNYDAQQGTCEKVDGQFDPDDRCLRFYESAEDEAKEGDESGMSAPKGEMMPPEMPKEMM